MPEKTKDSNLDNEISDTAPQGVPELPKTPEDKNSSTPPAASARATKPKVSSEPPADADAEPEDPETDQAVEDIVRQEGDEALAAEDAELAKAFEPPKRPWYKKIFAKKKVWIPLAALIILIILAAVPFTRYKILGLVWKQNMPIVVLDAKTHQPVSRADVVLRGVEGLTNSDGKLVLRVPVGSATATVSKRYYKTDHTQLLVSLRKPHTATITLTATGRQVPLKVIDKVSHQPIANATITADKTSVRTNEQGVATIVLPANQSSAAGQVSGPAGSYNPATVTIQVSAQPGSADTFQLTPSGRVYFLSNASGKIDVVGANLDGSDRQTILAGTGNESPTATQLTHSADWKYLALLATRTASTADNGTLYFINPATGQLATVQSGIQTYITVVGWSADDHLIYLVSNNTVGNWQPGGETLESYNPTTGKSTTLYQTTAAGTSSADYANQTINNEFILPGNTVLYTTQWTASYPTTSVSSADKQIGIYTVSTTGTNKQTVKTFPTDFTDYLSAVENKPGDYYLAEQGPAVPTYYEYTNGNLRVAPDNINGQTFNNLLFGPQTAYYLSPNGSATVWKTTQDGQSVIERGDASASNTKQIASLDGTFGAAGWYGNNYVLVEKNNSQLFIMPANGLTGSLQPVKITDYFAPSNSR